MDVVLLQSICKGDEQSCKQELAVRHKEQVSNIKVLFNKYVNSKRRTMENTGQIRDGDGHLTIKDEEEAEVFHVLFASFFSICDRS